MKLPITIIVKRMSDNEFHELEERYNIALSNAENFPSEASLRCLSTARQRYNFFNQLKDLYRSHNQNHKEEAR